MAEEKNEISIFGYVGIEKYIDCFRITEPEGIYPDVTTLGEVGTCAMNYIICLALGERRNA